MTFKRFVVDALIIIGLLLVLCSISWSFLSGVDAFSAGRDINLDPICALVAVVGFACLCLAAGIGKK